MRLLFRLFWLPIYRIWVLRYIQQERTCEYAGLFLRIPPGVFHPGVFFSTPIFASFLQSVDFQQKKVLDIGTGSGLLALFAAQRSAQATAIDIHPLAAETARQNAALNLLPLTVLESDLFDALPLQSFDIILINPPYYPRKPQNTAENAFFAGENLEYFTKLYQGLGRYMHRATEVWMVLSVDCDLNALEAAARRSGFDWQPVFEKKKWGEKFLVIAQRLTSG